MSRGPLPCDYPRVNIPKNLKVLPTTEQPQPYVPKKGGIATQDGKTAKPVEEKAKNTKVESKDSHPVQHEKPVKVPGDTKETHEKPESKEKSTPNESGRGKHSATHTGEEDHGVKDHVSKEHKNEEHKTEDHKPQDHKHEDKEVGHKVVDHVSNEHKTEQHKPVDHKHDEHKELDHRVEEHKHEEHKTVEHKVEEHKQEEHKTVEHKHEEHKKVEHKIEEHTTIEHKHLEHGHEEHKIEEHTTIEHKHEEHVVEETHHSEQATRHPAPKHTHKSSVGESSARDALNISGNISLPSNPEDAAEAYVDNLIERSENNIVNT